MVNEYLSEAFPPAGELGASPLLPASPAGRAKARIIAQRSNDLVTAYFTYLSNKDEVGTTYQSFFPFHGERLREDADKSMEYSVIARLCVNQ